MFEIERVVHLSIPVSDLKKSIQFYSDVVRCKLLKASEKQAFMDAGGTCVILWRMTPPINKPDSPIPGVHHAFAISKEAYSTINDHLAAHGVEVLYSHEDRKTGTVNGPRTYFKDPDGTTLEFIYLTHYDATPAKVKAAGSV